MLSRENQQPLVQPSVPPHWPPLPRNEEKQTALPARTLSTMSLVLSRAVTISAPHANTIRSGTNSSRISLKIINPSSERLSVVYGYDRAIIIGHHCHRRHHCHQQQNGRTISRSTFFFCWWLLLLFCIRSEKSSSIARYRYATNAPPAWAWEGCNNLLVYVFISRSHSGFKGGSEGVGGTF